MASLLPGTKGANTLSPDQLSAQPHVEQTEKQRIKKE